MMIKAILFDLDGTLLPMVQEDFVKGYFGELCKRFVPEGYEPKQLVETLWKGTKAMVKNDGNAPNMDRFWSVFADVYGAKCLDDIEKFDDFYGNEFNRAEGFTQPTPLANRCVKAAKAKGYPVILATNPIFPRVATLARIKWAGLDQNDFDWITTYENSTRCKPNPAYYAEICKKRGLDPAQCLMIGNDVAEDLPAASIGMETYLVTDCLNEAKDVDITSVNQGTMSDLLAYLHAMPRRS